MKITIKNEVEIPDVTKFRKLFEKLVTKEGRTRLQDAIFYCSMFVNDPKDIHGWGVECILFDSPCDSVIDLLKETFDSEYIVVYYQYDTNSIHDKLKVLAPETMGA